MILPNQAIPSVEWPAQDKGAEQRMSLSQHPFSSRKLAWIASVIFCVLPPALAQQTSDLQQQLQQLKQQYEQTTKDLQQRISVLEQQIDAEKDLAQKEKETTVSAAELAAERVVKKTLLGDSDQVGSNFQGQIASPPTYDLLQEAESKIAGLEQQLGTFEFHGYFRSGYGLNSKGGQQVAFQAGTGRGRKIPSGQRSGNLR